MSRPLTLSRSCALPPFGDIGIVTLHIAQTLMIEALDSGIDIYGSDYQQKLWDMMADEVDSWLKENAAEFGYIYLKEEI